MIGRTCAIALAAMTLAACTKVEKQPPTPPAARMTVADSGIKAPESALYDVAGDGYLVSNVNGNPLDKDGNGFISRVTPDGNIAELKWIAGGANGVTLNAPKGMAIKGDTLFVADIDAVRLFDRTTGAPLGSWTVKGAVFLNDVAIGPDGTVYVTDTGMKAGAGGFTPAGTDAVYRFGPGGKAVAVAKDPKLGGPNGITVDSSGITVVTFGSGDVYRLDAKTGARTDLPKPPKGQLDGVERLTDGSLLISSWEGQAVYRFSTGGYTIAVDSVASPADIGYDTKHGNVLIPMMMQNKIEIRGVK
ncbi:MAG: SMP-30/gluconolactonase/LRE family protein [Gemmatimonadetes bacterium]|nr:SMP-30/gluconolactonase/LRE family protein [Gemmatimonadota bacterium]